MTDTDIIRALQEAKRLLCVVDEEIHRRSWKGAMPALVAYIRQAKDCIGSSMGCRIPQATSHELTKEQCEQAIEWARNEYVTNPTPQNGHILQMTKTFARERFPSL